MTTNDVIDLLRKVRGAIAITIVRGGDDDGSWSKEPKWLEINASLID